MGDLQAQKRALRLACRARLAALSPDQRASRGLAIRQHLETLPAFRSARVVLGFAPLPDEPDIAPLLIRAMAEGKAVAVPRVDWEQPAIVPAQVRDWHIDLVADQRQLLVPSADCPLVPVDAIDVILVPGLAFDRAGRRLGRGGGFYDRFLATAPARAARVGVAFEAQVVDSVPVGDQDCTVSALVTEAGTLGASR